MSALLMVTLWLWAVVERLCVWEPPPPVALEVYVPVSVYAVDPGAIALVMVEAASRRGLIVCVWLGI